MKVSLNAHSLREQDRTYVDSSTKREEQRLENQDRQETTLLVEAANYHGHSCLCSSSHVLEEITDHVL